MSTKLEPQSKEDIEKMRTLCVEIAGHALIYYNGEILHSALEAAKHLRQYIWHHETLFPKEKK